MLRARRGSPEKKSVSARYSKVRTGRYSWQRGRRANVFKVLKEVGDSLALVFGEDILVQGIAGFALGRLALRRIQAQLEINRTSTARGAADAHGR